MQVSGWSVLMCVAKYGHLGILGLLVDYGAEVDAQDKVILLMHALNQML